MLNGLQSRAFMRMIPFYVGLAAVFAAGFIAEMNKRANHSSQITKRMEFQQSAQVSRLSTP